MSQVITLGVGQQVPVAATFQDAAHQPAPDEPITWVSSSPSVASIPGSGAYVQITAVDVGTTTITATSGTLTSDIVVTVVPVYPAFMNLALGTPTGP
jgi:uncharacterized protein YjdB